MREESGKIQAMIDIFESNRDNLDKFETNMQHNICFFNLNFKTILIYWIFRFGTKIANFNAITDIPACISRNGCRWPAIFNSILPKKEVAG